MGKYFFNKETGKWDYEPSIGESFGDAIGGIGLGISDLLLKGLLALAIIVPVIVGVLPALGGLFLTILGMIGLRDMPLVAHLSQPANTSITYSQVSMVIVSNQKKPEMVVSAFDETWTANVEVNGNNQSIYVSYDGMLGDCGAYVMPDSVDGSEVSFSFLPSRAVLLEFVDGNGNSIQPSNLVITDETGAEISTAVAGDRYTMILPEISGSKGLTFTAEGYQAVTVTENWDACRLGKLEVSLNAQ